MSMRALLASPLGFLVGVALGALGGGGSILAVPILVFLVGLTPSSATSTSLVVVGVASLVGAYEHWRSGRVRVATGLVFGLVGIGGSIAGSALNRHLDGDLLLLAFAGLTLVAAWRILVGCPSCTKVEYPAGETEARATVRTRTRQLTRTPAATAKIAVAGTTVGFLTGLFGVGGGFIIVPVLALVLAFPMPAAVGTSLLVIAVNSAAALAPRLGGGIDWGTTLIFGVAAIAGVVSGKRIADRLDAKVMQQAFAALLVGVALYTGTRAFLAL
jgi:uncharacterized membrane protein YfcA